jgi:two-component system, OmpR family, phosphate regulon response regulator PhoB
MDERTIPTAPDLPHLLVVGDFLLNRETIRVWRGDKPLSLSLRQFRLLEIFMQHPGEPLSRADLKRLVWGPEARIRDDTVTVEVARLRRIVGGRRGRGPIRTVRSIGFVFDASKG